jgi:uncharacterized membrane protein YdbT with pleckstrin-like domain
MPKLFFPTLPYALINPFALLVPSFVLIALKSSIAIFIAQNLNFNSIIYIDILIFLFFFIYAYHVFYIIITKYTLTDEQLTITKGVFSINVDYLELYRVKDIEIRKSFFSRLIGVYTIILHTSDKTHPIIKIYGINFPNLTEKIRQQVEHLRKTKRVYEVD